MGCLEHLIHVHSTFSVGSTLKLFYDKTSRVFEEYKFYLVREYLLEICTDRKTSHQYQKYFRLCESDVWGPAKTQSLGGMY